jgi:hypothetical protein
MKTLRQSLIDFDLGMLKAIASRRAISIQHNKKKEMIDQMVNYLLSPINIALATEELTADERKALDFVILQGGKVEAARFIRQFGAIRPMGPARLEREQPWLSPANPAEGLWYSAFIFRAFQVKKDGGTELFYIPSDILQYLKSDQTTANQPAQLQPGSVPAPPHIETGTGRLRENFFSMLVYLQTHAVQINNNELSERDREGLSASIVPAPPFVVNELDFLIHVGLRTALLDIIHGKLRPNRTTIRNWLQASPFYQEWQLQNGWRADPSWNDLWQVPELVPQPTGWENSPLRVRSKILAFLEQLPARAWFDLDGFIAFIKGTEPDFQRPDGDYKSWYIQDRQGALLMGFEYWDAVEGNLIRYIITNILFSLSIVDIGSDDDTTGEKPTHFSITEAGQRFLNEPEPPSTRSTPSPRFRVDEKLRVRVPHQANLLDRFQVARFAELSQREENRMIYLITQPSVARALQNGVTHNQITAFLNRVTDNQLPLKVVDELRRWGTRMGTVKLENVSLLRLATPQLLAEIQQIPEIAHLLGEVISPTAILIPHKNVGAVRKTLKESGYL